ncbi:RagB/SusD family nutrient uptake outer membrane protein [Flavobacterium cellulosilyticum]|uniref:RagB/SusD family nutrient uptake outer membrane protein n=1 Tax=Flavobacterium cellulosilyticum TaxID=2541731 RepID=A0A4R5C8M1_9FLAO|nr:RagB/SusD family nutrient uptake outer membrane protein [Flavobacterium cellulosilyticum]TDD95515.1 RagB/SusD family nutrient uptake outer membrane protein [Flavobacterium cellulosilyticum]
MKNIKIKSLFIATVVIFTTMSCSNEFLEVAPKGTNLESNYYTNETQAFAGVVAVYDVMRKNSGGFDNMITMMNAGSDDNYAGGGNATDGAGIQGFSNYTISPFNVPTTFWSDHYKGIYRANYLLTKLPAIPMSADLMARYTAECKALRANYYFNLVRMFKNVPLILTPLSVSEYYSVKQATQAEVYTQIEKDLSEAITVLPATVPAADAGRFTIGAAKALLGKVYLYDPAGKKALAATELAAVNGTPGGTSQYGYKLLSNYSDLWIVDNKFNTESILDVAHTNVSSSGWGNWGSDSDEGDTVNVMCGPRTYTKIGASAPDLPSGWSFNIFTQNFYDVIKTDPRFGATVLDLKALSAANQASYIAGYQDTGYFLNKFIPRKSDVTKGTGEPVLNYRQNSYVIRLADTYLMEAEALGGTGTRAQALLDAVRARVGLASTPVSIAAIKAERRLELAGEGHRFFDLVRWGDATAALASRGFKAGKNEVFPIPYSELQNTLLVQNPGYTN